MSFCRHKNVNYTFSKKKIAIKFQGNNKSTNNFISPSIIAHKVKINVNKQENKSLYATSNFTKHVYYSVYSFIRLQS